VKRIIWNVLSFVSLAICLTLIGLGIWSHSRTGGIAWNQSMRLDSLQISGGELEYACHIAYTADAANAPPIGWEMGTVDSARDDLSGCLRTYGGHHIGSFYYCNAAQHWGTSSSACWYMFFVPVWFACTLLAIAPSVRCVQWRGERKLRTRSSQGQCIRCGYDLRATPDRCPECGFVPRIQ
jgi:hypothetical protein